MSKFMKAAIVQAKKAYALGEVPIGCVIVKDNQIIARGYNRRSIDHNTLAHAEMIAIKKSLQKARRLAARRLYHVHHARALPYVCRCDCAS